jgi:hypothetical protein
MSVSVNANVAGTSTGGGGTVDLSTPWTAEGAQIVPDANIVLTANAGTINMAKAINTVSSAVDIGLTFNSTPAVDTIVGLLVTNTSSTVNISVTIPTSTNVKNGAVVTNFWVAKSSRAFVQWRYTGTDYELHGEPGFLDNLNSTSSPISADGVLRGYGPGSRWIKNTATAKLCYTCVDNTSGAAKWTASAVKLLGSASGSSASVDATSFDVGNLGSNLYTMQTVFVVATSNIQFNTSDVGSTIVFDATGELQFSAGAGILIGGSSTVPIGFFGAAGVARPTTASAAATVAGSGGTTVTTGSTFDGYTVAQVVKALRDFGLLT